MFYQKFLIWHVTVQIFDLVNQSYQTQKNVFLEVVSTYFSLQLIISITVASKSCIQTNRGFIYISSIIFDNVQGAFMVVVVWQLDLQLPVQLVPITINIVNLNPAHGNVYSIQLHVFKFVSDIRQDGGFFRVLLFPPPIKPTATIITEILLNTINSTMMIINVHILGLAQWQKILHKCGCGSGINVVFGGVVVGGGVGSGSTTQK